MAITTYRVQFLQQYMSYNPGEIGWFDAVTAQRLVGEGRGTALDALPGATSENPTLPDQAVITDSGLPAPASPADSAALANEAGMLPTS
jgi:hypothetical protein